MFFFFSKILYFLINPITWILICFVLAYFFKKKTRFFVLLGLFLLLFFGNSAIHSFFVSKWEIKPIAPQNIIQKYDYVIVLGGMASVNPENQKVHVAPSIDRIITAINLYHHGQVKKIVVTGGLGLLIGKEKKEAGVIKDFCIDMAVKEQDVIVEQQSRNTYENALFTKQKIGIPEKKVLLITSAWHMRRSIGCFKKQGFKFDVLSADPSVKPQLFFDDYFLPKSEILMKWDYLLKEWIGYIAYKVAGYI